MDEMQKKVLRALGRHGLLSQTQLYRQFNRYRAKKKNDAIDKLLQRGMIKRELVRSSPKAKKPTRFFKIAPLGHEYLSQLKGRKGFDSAFEKLSSVSNAGTGR